MEHTRRSFIKKSSYSAVVVGILGTGSALADGPSSGPELLHLSTQYTITTGVNDVVFEVDADDVFEAMFLAIALLLGLGKTEDLDPLKIEEWGNIEDYDAPGEGETWSRFDSGGVFFEDIGGGKFRVTYSARGDGTILVNEVFLRKKMP